MKSCPHCRHEAALDQQECPRCGTDLFTSTDGEDRAVEMPGDADFTPHEPIARFTNIAEAGYFHSELEGHLDCEVRLRSQDHFDAPTASWRSDFVLTVPADDAHEATAVLKQLITETDHGEILDFGGQPDSRMLKSSSEAEHTPRIHWTPIVLTLAAGTFVVWATKQAQLHFRGAGAQAGQGASLWDTMRESREPWVQRPEDGHGRREISVDPDGNMATLREDTDGDGIFDHVAHLPLTNP